MLPRSTRRLGTASVVLLGLAALPGALVALPLAYVGLRVSEVGFIGIWAELARPLTMELLANTLILATSVTFLAALIAVAAAWCTERCDLPFRSAWRVLLSLPLAVPALVASYAWSSLGEAFQGMTGAILALTLTSVPLIYLPVVAALRGLDPAFEQVARTLGRGPLHSFLTLVLRQIAPAIGGGALLISSHMLSEFGALSFLQVQTFATAIFQQYDLQFDNAAAALLSGVLILLCLPVVLAEMRLRSDRRLSGIARSSPKPPARIALAGWKWPTIALLSLEVLLALGVPLATLCYWLANGSSAGLGIARVLPALFGSLSYSLPGGLFTTLLALPVVLAAIRLRGPFATFADRLPFIIHGLPGIVIALALVFFCIRYVPALYQTPAPVFLAYAMLFLPLAQSALRASAELVPPELEQVARTLGRGPLAAFVRVTLPNLLPGFAAGLSMVVLQLMRELTATLVLAPSGVVTLATEFWFQTSERAYGAAAPFAAVLILISGIPVYLLSLRRLQK